MRDRFKNVLINPTWEQMVERDPFLAYSNYLSGRIHVLLDLSDEIILNLDQGFSAHVIDGGRLGRADSLMWLWILGAYEVVRTMCQSGTCFSKPIHNELRELKKTLAEVRMPAAKMEKSGAKVPIPSDRSPSGWSTARRDLLVNAPSSTSVFARDLIDEFDRVLSSIKPADILARHEDAYTDQA
ncbi:hypothetical protein [Dyella sp. ASV21]|uniref:hypothetical protein n=1 Tax=Dyella sp. ASV21 TaxID=2795114 RepID=UPI0018EA9A88|nr:hypothetical protein [Dyella sp. ASV21]